LVKDKLVYVNKKKKEYEEKVKQCIDERGNVVNKDKLCCLKDSDSEWDGTEELGLNFYAWECITLITEDRDIDIVIRDLKMMHIFIQFLIIKLNTYNGIKDSFNFLVKKRVVKKNETILDRFHHVYRSYFIMKVRMKISFEALKTNRTIQELFLFSILKTYHERKSKHMIKNPYPKIS